MFENILLLLYVKFANTAAYLAATLVLCLLLLARFRMHLHQVVKQLALLLRISPGSLQVFKVVVGIVVQTVSKTTPVLEFCCSTGRISIVGFRALV